MVPDVSPNAGLVRNATAAPISAGAAVDAENCGGAGHAPRCVSAMAAASVAALLTARPKQTNTNG